MIITVKNAILHVLDAESGHAFLSSTLLDTTDVKILDFLSSHISKLIDDASLRTAQFKQASGFKYQLGQYLENKSSFVDLSKNIATKLYDAVHDSDKKDSFDLLVVECTAHEHKYIAVLKCNNRSAVTHSVLPLGDDYNIQILDDYSIMPGKANKLTECAFVDMDNLSIKYKDKKVSIDGESQDLFADILLECEYEYSTKESFNKVQKIAKAVATELAGDTIEAGANLKTFVKETPADKKEIVIEEIAEKVFPKAPAARNEFIEKVREAEIPPAIERHPYIEKAVRTNMKLVTDTGIEISFPSEYYRDNKNLSIITNEDGTLEINIGNISEIVNK